MMLVNKLNTIATPGYGDASRVVVQDSSVLAGALDCFLLLQPSLSRAIMYLTDNHVTIP